MLTMRKKNRETLIRNGIKEYLQYSGFFVWIEYQSQFSYKGVSDLIATKDGKTLFIEVKTETGKQSDDQIKFQKDIEDHGGTYLLVRSIDEVDAFVKKEFGDNGLLI